jgi:hypothetical protein
MPTGPDHAPDICTRAGAVVCTLSGGQQIGRAQLTDPAPPAPTALRTAARNYQRALDQLTQEAGLAA